VLALVTVCVGLLPQGASASAEPALQSIAYEAVVPAYGHDAKVVREHGIPGIRRGSSIQNGAASSGGRVLTPAAFDKDAFSNGVAGFGDDLTFGATSWARRTINEKYLGGCGDVIDASSTAHTAGRALGFAAGLAVPTGYVGRAFGQVSKLLAGSKAGRTANTALRPAQVALGPVPENAWATFGRVQSKGSPLPGYKGGSTFGSTGQAGGQVFPRSTSGGSPITYREWDVNPYVKGVDRRAERIVTGSDGSAYYTSDHYRSFTQFWSGV